MASDQQPIADPINTTVDTPVADPLRALDELMVVVEALCPVWPPRPLFTGKEKMLL